MRIITFAALAAMLCTGAAQAGLVSLDISSAFNYDAVGTQAEIAYANTFAGQDHTLMDILGNHDMRYRHTYLGDHADGLPADGIIDGGNFELGRGLDRRYDTADADAKQNNVIRVAANTRETNSAEVFLAPAEQQRYTNINFAFASQRYKLETSKSYDFTASVEAKYVGDSDWYTVWSSVGGSKVLGGSFGTGTASGGVLNWQTGTDTPEWALAHTTTLRCGSTGGAGDRSSVVRTEATYIWKFADNLALDSTKALEGFRVSVGTTGANRNNVVNVFAASATPVPEPATITMTVLGLGAVASRFRRRLR